MNKFGIALLLVIAAVAGCAQDPKKQIVGKWKTMDGSGQTMEFLPTGELKMTQRSKPPGLKTSFKYEVVDATHLKITMNFNMGGLSKPVPGRPDLNKGMPDMSNVTQGFSVINDMKMDGDHLTLTMAGSKPQTLERVPA